MVSQGCFPAVLRFTANLLENRIKGVEQSLGKRYGARDTAIIEAKLEAALTTLESNELSNLAHADMRRHA
jgi:hypothetical protein